MIKIYKFSIFINFFFYRSAKLADIAYRPAKLDDVSADVTTEV